MSKWEAHELKVYQNKFRRCDECGRGFDLTIDADRDDFFFGHDCEA